jgi:hypothetical protein
MRRCAYLVSSDDGTSGRCPRMTRFEVLDDGVWPPRCDLHRRFDPGAETGPPAATVRKNTLRTRFLAVSGRRSSRRRVERGIRRNDALRRASPPTIKMAEVPCG